MARYAIRICVPDYVAAHEDAERRIKLGQKQRKYKRCGRWHWANEKCDHPRIEPWRKKRNDAIRAVKAKEKKR